MAIAYNGRVDDPPTPRSPPAAPAPPAPQGPGPHPGPHPGSHQNAIGSVTIIEAGAGRPRLDLQDVWEFRELLWVLVARDVKVRYKQTVLGAGWAIIQPVLTMVVFSIFFGRLAKMPSDGLPYPIFVYAGLLPWTFFANAISTASGSMVGSANLVSKVYFPRLIIPLSSIGVGLLDFVVASAVLGLMMLYYDLGWSLRLLVAPVLVLGIVFTALGVGLILSALNVAYRDFRYTVPFMVQLWLFATPVVYPSTIVPERWQWVLFLNPVAGMVEGFRAAVLDRPFDLEEIGISVAVSILLFVTGIYYFKRVERRFADII